MNRVLSQRTSTRAAFRGKSRSAIAFACGALAAAWLVHGPAPGRDLGALAAALGRAADGAEVSTNDVRWEPSGGMVTDLVVGRRLLFLARSPADETRDVWRARARLAPDGSVLDVQGAHNLTNTPLGDDHALVARGRYAAFATRAYGQEQSVTVLNLIGEGAQNKTTDLLSRAMAAITNVQRTGTPRGVGRVDVTFESPGRAVGLLLDDAALEVTLFGGDSRRPPTVTATRVNLLRGELDPPVDGIHTDASMHLPKRFSHWTVDTLRAVPWIGPAPIAWIEDQALSLRDVYRRTVFSSHGSATDVVSSVEPAPPLLDTSQASVDEAHWPPQTVATIWKSPQPGEGEWVVPDVAWLRQAHGASADVPSPFYETYVRPDADRPYAKVLLVAMDMRQLDLDMEAGVEDPEPLTGPPGPGRIPRDPLVYRRVGAAFNGAFKTEHGHYGMMVHKRVLLPPLPGSATIVVLEDGGVGFGTWGADRKIGGIVGVNDDDIASFRQNLDPLLDHGEINPTGRNLWGFTLPGKGAQTERTGLCVTTSGHIVYAWGDDVSATTLARALKMASCDFALHLDMNPYHTGFLFTALEDLAAKKYRSQLLTPAMSIPVDRYIQYAPKDFFYVLAHDPTPPQVKEQVEHAGQVGQVEGAGAWRPDGGAQPPPQWIAGLWTLGVPSPEGVVELLDVEPGRATWRIRAGARDASAAAPLRDLGADQAKHALFAVGMGVASDKRPLGLATDGRLSVALRGESGSGVIVIDGAGRLGLDLAESAPALEAHDDLAELPVVLWDGRVAPSSVVGAVAMRAAIGTTASGRVLLARGRFASAFPLASALAQAGCTRGLSLDRGLHAAGLFDRAGTDHPLRSRYDETVLFALGTPLRPRAFRFEPSTVALQTAKSK